MTVAACPPEALERARAGDVDAFAEIYETYADRVRRYVRRSTSEPADAEDVTSEVFLRAFTHIGRYRWEGTAFVAWLYTIARNASIDQRRRRRPTVDLDEARELASREPTAHELAVRAEGLRTLRDAMTCLTEEQRSVVELRYLHDLPSAAVATRIGKSDGAVRALQFRAAARLRAALGDGDGSAMRAAAT